MLAVVTGASGLLGGNLAIELIQRGHRVRATQRGGSKVGHLSGFPIEWQSADLGDVDALARAFEGADAVFHCAAQVSIIRKISPLIRSANVEGTSNVISAVRRSKVRRMVHCSTVGAVGLSEDGKPCDESSAWNFAKFGMDDAYVTTKHLAEEVVHAAGNDGLDAVIVNPTFMFGAYDSKPSSGKMIVAVARHKTPGWTEGVNNFVDVRDVARGMILACEKGARGERYILGSENLTYREVFGRIAREAGVTAPSWKIPRWAARTVGLWGDLSASVTGKEPLVNSTSVMYGYTDRFQFSSEKAKRQLGYAPGPIDGAIRDALRWFREQRMI